jgi:hypothetical protein
MKSVSPQPFSCLDDASELCCREWMSEECVVQKCKTSSLFTQSSSLQEGARIVINAPMRTPKCNQQNLLEPKEGWRKLNKNSLSQGCHFTQIWKGGKKGRKVYDCTETARKGPCKMVAGSLSKCVCNPERANKHARTHARTHAHTHTHNSLSLRGFDTKCVQNWVPERGIIRSGWKQGRSTRETKVKHAYAVSSSPESPDYLCAHENTLLATRVPKAQKSPRCS